MQRAKKVLENGDKKLVVAIDRGEVTVTDAAAIVMKPHPTQIKALDMVAEGKASSLQTALRKQDLAQRIQEIEDGEWTAPDQYDVIVFDPPWETMSWDEVEALCIPRYAASNCVLWIWTTHRHILGPFYLMRRWTFEHQFVLTWVKDRRGQRPKKSEFCIMAVSGSPSFNSTNPTTVIEAPARPKNRKPDEFYELVDSLCVGRKLDYFSREKRDGWEQYGNDPAKFGDVA